MDGKKAYTTFESIERIINALPRIASLIVGSTAFAYLIGFIYAKAYFEVFGATWLVTELSTGSLLSNSLVPIAFLLFLCYLAILDLEEKDETEKWMSAVVRYGRIIIISFIVLQVTLHLLKLRTVFVIISYIFAAASFGLLVIKLKEPKFKWNLSSTYLTYGILIGGFYFAPSNMGTARGYVDINPSTSKLPIVQLRDNEKEFRLVYHKNDTYYIFLQENTEEYPNILLIDKSQIKAIRKK